MSQPTQYFAGLDGFIWFIGVVVGSPHEDALKVGRTKVRIVGHHTNELPISDLPWAMPIYPVNTIGGGGVPGYKNGDWVFGFFLDGTLAQQPMILGILPAIPQGQPFFNDAASTVSKLI